MTQHIYPPACPHHPVCPGCPHLSEPSYAASIEHKSQQVTRALRRASIWPLEPPQTFGAQTVVGWRTRARYVVNPHATGPEDLLGFYAQGTRAVVPISTCLAHCPGIEAALGRLKPALFGMPQLRQLTAYVEARQLGPDRVDVTLCLRGTPAQEAAAVAMAAQLEAQAFGASSAPGGPQVVLWVRTGGRGASVGSGQAQRVSPGEADEVQVELAASGRQVAVPLGAFFQQHPEQLDLAHRIMCDWLGGSPSSVLDLYCGVGAHGLGLLAPGGQLYATDVHGGAVACLQRSAMTAGDVQVVTTAVPDGQLGEWLGAHLERVEVAVTNPARAGMHPEVSSWLLGSGRRTITQGLVYMSCHLPTLVRDLVRLSRGGAYRLERVAVLDMMPWTGQIEVLAMLSPAPLGQATASGQKVHWAFELGQEPAPRSLSLGVSGVAPRGERSTWLAVVAGKAPKHGMLPAPREASLGDAQIACTRVFCLENHYSGVQLECTGPCSDAQLRQRLRGWGHPVVGDVTYGRRKVNRRAKLKFYLDRMLLHCLASGSGQGAVRAELDRDWPWEFWREFSDDSSKDAL